MTQSDGEQGQKTVAELLAQHGGQSGGSRRRRRRADEQTDNGAAQDRRPDMGDTAPQAIIDRVRSDAPEQAPHGRANGAHPNGVGPNGADPHGSGPLPRRDRGADAEPTRRRVSPVTPPPGPPPMPGAAQPSGQFPQPPEQPSGQYPAPPVDRRSGAFPRPPAGPPPEQPFPSSSVEQPTGWHPAPSAQPSGQFPVQGGAQASGAHPAPPIGREPDSTDVDTGYFTPGPPTTQQPRRRPAPPGPPPRREQYTDQLPPVAESSMAPMAQSDLDGPSAAEPPAGLADWRRRRAAAAQDTMASMPPVAPEYDEPLDEQDPADMPLAHDGQLAPADLPAGYPPESADYPADYDSDELADYEPGYAGDLAADYDDELPEDEPSPMKQWLHMAGQLVLGLIAGAGVWLGFNWLWGKLPAAALVAAVVVIAGMVWIVRKIRKADDLQTTVLAVLVGLVVTVSPAALLLLAK